MKKNINGDLLTVEQAYRTHYKLVKDTAKKFVTQGFENGFELEDLISTGKVAFVEAFNRFDERPNVRFTTYATSVMMGRIRDEIYLKNGKERIGERIKLRAREFAAMEIEDVSVKTIQKALNMHYVYAVEVLHYLMHYKPVPIEKKVGKKQKDGKKKDVYVINTLKTDSDFTRIYVEEFKSLLTEKELQVLELLLQEYTQKEIQSILGLKRSAVNMRVVKMRYKYKEMMEGVNS